MLHALSFLAFESQSSRLNFFVQMFVIVLNKVTFSTKALKSVVIRQRLAFLTRVQSYLSFIMKFGNNFLPPIAKLLLSQFGVWN